MAIRSIAQDLSIDAIEVVACHWLRKITDTTAPCDRDFIDSAAVAPIQDTLQATEDARVSDEIVFAAGAKLGFCVALAVISAGFGDASTDIGAAVAEAKREIEEAAADNRRFQPGESAA